MLKIIAAFLPLCTGNLPFKTADKTETVPDKANGLLPRYPVAQNKVKAGTAAHWTDIDDIIRIPAVARLGRKQMLKGVQSPV